VFFEANHITNFQFLSKINVREFQEDELNHSSIFLKAFHQAQVTFKLIGFQEIFNQEPKYSQVQEKNGRI
jgi:hypothetical protein